MWTARLKIKHEESWACKGAKKHNVTLYCYPLTFYSDKNKDYISSYHIVYGDEKRKKAYIDEIKSLSQMKFIDIEGDQYIFSYYIPRKETRLLRNVVPGLIFTKPIIIKPDGWQYVEVAAWKKNILNQFIKNTKKGYDIEFLMYKEEKVAKITMPLQLPNLSGMQDKVVKLAYEMGYYDFPKKTNIRKLAKALKISESTCQEHLRMAESKMMPFILENLTKHSV
ncbi:MAG: helix-turn-helix domain-containing protein [Candidatus Woesearchaeota archaeon]